MLFQRTLLSSVIPLLLTVASLSFDRNAGAKADSSSAQPPRTTSGIANPEQYLATAAAANKLGECLPTSTDDDTAFNCFAKLRAIATGTGRPTNRTGSTKSATATLQYVHNTDDCVDDDVDACPDWAEYGECHSNPAYMLTHCRYSCQTCTHIVDGHGGTVQVAPGSDPELHHSITRHITETAQYIRRIRKQYPRASTSCRNQHADCTYKAVQGHCLFGSDTASWMHHHCPAACRTCV